MFEFQGVILNFAIHKIFLTLNYFRTTASIFLTLNYYFRTTVSIFYYPSTHMVGMVLIDGFRFLADYAVEALR